MAKFKFIKKMKEKDISKQDVSKGIWNIAAGFIEFLDDGFGEIEEISKAGCQAGIFVGAKIIDILDAIGAISDWFFAKTAVTVGRRWHDVQVNINKHKKFILKNIAILGLGSLFLVGVFSWATDYEYSYRGRALGIVEEQRDVIEILELTSEELSKEYGTNIVLDPKTDITFRPVSSYGKEIDSQDKVLEKLTYMGELNAQACAIKADGKILVVVENEKIAEQVLQDIKDIFITDSDSVEYEYIGFAEEIKLEGYSTTLKNISSRKAAVDKIRSGGQQSTDYIVEKGDTVYGICQKLGVSVEELEALNPNLNLSLIHIGDAITVQREIPLITLETVEVATYAESIPYETVYQNSSYYYEGEQAVSRNGSNGKASVTARLTKRNGEVVDREEISREVIVQPVDKIVLKGTKQAPPKKGTGSFIRPVNVGIYSGYGWRWGRMHDGIDLAASTGTPIKASDGGTVVHSGWYYGYGYTVIIDHGGGVKTLYGHNSANYVSVGEKVFQGQVIAAVGNTGNSTGPHCHFEIMMNGRNVNPSLYV